MNGDSGTQNTTGTNYGVVFNGTVIADCGVDIKDTSGDGGLLSDNYTGVNGGGEDLRPALDDTVISDTRVRSSRLSPLSVFLQR